MVQFYFMYSCCVHSCTEYAYFIEPVAWINHAISFLVERIACLAVPGFLCVQDICFIGI